MTSVYNVFNEKTQYRVCSHRTLAKLSSQLSFRLLLLFLLLNATFIAQLPLHSSGGLLSLTLQSLPWPVHELSPVTRAVRLSQP
jgi:hypothetical protein